MILSLFTPQSQGKKACPGLDSELTLAEARIDKERGARANSQATPSAPAVQRYSADLNLSITSCGPEEPPYFFLILICQIGPNSCRLSKSSLTQYLPIRFERVVMKCVTVSEHLPD